MACGEPMNQRKSYSPSTQEKISLFRSFFTGLPHLYGMRDPESDRQFQVKHPVTDHVLYHHLKGKRHYGVYLLNESLTKAVVADFDTPDTWVVLEFVNAARTTVFRCASN